MTSYKILLTAFTLSLCLDDLVKGDVVCDMSFGYPIKYCYGVTAYCCGAHYQDCCWEKIWKVWWFWVVAFVVVTAIFSCCGYYCSSSAENGRYGLLRSDSFNIFHRFRRFSSYEYSSTDEQWKPPEVELPPYTPTPSTSRGVGASIDPDPPQNMPYLEPPPPYTTVASYPQPESSQATSLLSNNQTNTDRRTDPHEERRDTTVSSN